MNSGASIGHSAVNDDELGFAALNCFAADKHGCGTNFIFSENTVDDRIGFLGINKSEIFFLGGGR